MVFIDWENTYRSARRAFCDDGTDPYVEGQIHPMALAEHVVNDSPYPRTLAGVRIYRGRPEETKQPEAYAANRRQAAAWERAGCDVFLRTLRYPEPWPEQRAEEKGVDVQLAIDFVTMAHTRAYDVGVLVSVDTDLKPALEAVYAIDGPIAETAAWRSPNEEWSPRLSLGPERTIWCHWLDEACYSKMRDTTPYSSSGP